MQSKNNRQDILTLIYNSTYLPMHYFVRQELIATFPQWTLPIDKFISYKNTIAVQRLSFDYFSINNLLYIGIIKNIDTDEDVVVGPVSLHPLSSEMIDEILDAYTLDAYTRQQTIDFLDRTPIFYIHQFLNIMIMINWALNGERLDINSVYKNTNASIEKNVAEKHSYSLMERKENENYHDTFFFEQKFYSIIEAGDITGLDTFFKMIPPLTEGSVGSTSIRQAKNIFIAAITLITRHAIAGGLDIETAYQLSDTYIQEMEKLNDANSITLLNQNVSYDFTRRVAEAKIPKGMSLEIFHCIQYISNHLNQPITVEIIASELNIERSTLSKKFKRELGFNISSYIMRRKLEEAKSLLTYTDKAISEISEYLCFSTQAYFQNVFKKKYGMTPREYRISSTK